MRCRVDLDTLQVLFELILMAAHSFGAPLGHSLIVVTADVLLAFYLISLSHGVSCSLMLPGNKHV